MLNRIIIHIALYNILIIKLKYYILVSLWEAKQATRVIIKEKKKKERKKYDCFLAPLHLSN